MTKFIDTCKLICIAALIALSLSATFPTASYAQFTLEDIDNTLEELDADMARQCGPDLGLPRCCGKRPAGPENGGVDCDGLTCNGCREAIAYGCRNYRASGGKKCKSVDVFNIPANCEPPITSPAKCS